MGLWGLKFSESISSLFLHLRTIPLGKDVVTPFWINGWLVVLRINVDLAIFHPYLDLEAGDNQSFGSTSCTLFKCVNDNTKVLVAWNRCSLFLAFAQKISQCFVAYDTDVTWSNVTIWSTQKLWARVVTRWWRVSGKRKGKRYHPVRLLKTIFCKVTLQLKCRKQLNENCNKNAWRLLVLKYGGIFTLNRTIESINCKIKSLKNNILMLSNIHKDKRHFKFIFIFDNKPTITNNKCTIAIS